LRFVLDRDQRNFIPLREELEFVRNYLDIEQTRFHDRLRIQYDIDQTTQDIRVPHLILQPLVENAIKHGFSNRSDEGRIEVITRRLGDQVELLIRDDGCGSDLSQEELLQLGIGLSNVQKRLELLYGAAAEIRISTEPESGFAVYILIPIENQEV
jgi:LytS/YehU family sensor histidine kinase